MQLRLDMLHAINNSIPHTTPNSNAKHEDTVKEHLLPMQEDETLRQKSCPVIALQLGPPSSSNNLPLNKSRPIASISNPKNPHFQDSQSRVFEEFIPNLLQLASHYMSLTSCQLFEVAVSVEPLPGCHRDLGDIAKCLAHIGVLHWRVWEPLVYMPDPGTETRGQQAGNSVGDLKGDVRLRDPPQGQKGQRSSLLRFHTSKMKAKKQRRAVMVACLITTLMVMAVMRAMEIKEHQVKYTE